MKLLIAIRSDVLTDILRSSLSQHDIYTCNTGTEAIRLLDSLQPDGLIIDLRLPVTDGLTVLNEAAYKPKYILAVTSITTEAVIQAALNAGVQEIIPIPFSIRGLIQHWEQITENNRSPVYTEERQ